MNPTEWRQLYNLHSEILRANSVVPSFDHQLLGVHNIVLDSAPGLLPDGTPDTYGPGRIHPGCFALFDEMGAGKTKQTIDAACMLKFMEQIDRVLVICPAPVRGVWFDEMFGQITQHGWRNLYHSVTEEHAKRKQWFMGDEDNPRLDWHITNYDFIRNSQRLGEFLRLCNGRTLLVLDESSAIKNPGAVQTKAVKQLRKTAGRVVQLNGTPIANNPLDLFSQANLMDPGILECKSLFIFKLRYTITGGWQNRVIIGWKEMPDLQSRMAPYCLRRMKKDCLDLPEKLPSVVLTATMTNETWKPYKQMRDDMVTWLNSATVSIAQQAIVKAMRLSQMTSGFLGGIEEAVRPQEVPIADRPEWLPLFPEASEALPVQPVGPLQEIGREKLDTFLDWLDIELHNDPNIKILVWCRFRPEVSRLLENLQNLSKPVGKRFPELNLGTIVGGQKPEDRNRALQLLDPRTMADGPTIVVGTPSTGSMGLNLVGSHTVVYMSNDHNLKTRLQSEDRTHRPGQRFDVRYFDIVAVGPNGQKTIDHGILKSLLAKEDMANMTAKAWMSVIRE